MKRSVFLKNQKGFTLLELILAFSILIIIMVVTGLFSTNILSSENIFQGSLVTQTETQQALQTMATEIRSMAPSNTGSYSLDTAATNTLIFYSDIDEDGLMERVRYFLSSTTLQKGVTKPSGSPLTYSTSSEIVVDVVHNVVTTSTPIFSYYDNNFTGSQPPLTQPINIASVTAIGIQVSAQGQSPTVGSYFNAMAVPRNLRQNL